MNYTKIYATIVLRAQSERTERLILKKQGKYFETHHIMPKSFGGNNDKSNLALLTAREHFICHWLLVKMYPVGSIERGKMLNALWRMQGISNNHKNRYINCRVYEYLRTEFARRQKEIEHQQGTQNSQYGKKWFTSSYTGESRSFRNTPPSNEWVPGRNVFNGQTSSIKHLIRVYQCKLKRTERLKQHENNIRNELVMLQQERHNAAVQYARMIWDKFHSSNYKKLEDFAKELGVSKVSLSHRFRKYIPVYTEHNQKKLKYCRSDKNLVGKYE